jgi:hypothetical protein
MRDPIPTLPRRKGRAHPRRPWAERGSPSEGWIRNSRAVRLGAAFRPRTGTGMASDSKAPRELRGILIDPRERDVREVRTTADLAAWYALIGCRTVDVVRLGETDHDPEVSQDLWVDDEGLLVPWQRQGFFVLRSPEDRPPIYYARPPIAGRALLLGSLAGATVSTLLDVDLVRESIRWLLPEQVVAPKPTIWDADDRMRPIAGTGAVVDGTDETTWDIHNQPSGARP